MPFSPPRAAAPGAITPRLLPTRFVTHLRPFQDVMDPIQAFTTRGVAYPQGMAPGAESGSGYVPAAAVPAGLSGFGQPQALPSYSYFHGFGAGPAIAMDTPAAPTAPGLPGGGSGHPNHRMMRAVPASPWMVRGAMRGGFWNRPAQQTERGIHAGIRQAPYAIRAALPGSYPYVGVPAGTYRRGGLG
jgi:hypothetical protein